MSTIRTYLSRIDEAGRLVIFRHDGVPITKDEQDWFAKTVTVQLRTDNIQVARPGHAKPLDELILVGQSRKTGEDIQVHPLIHELQALVQVRGWRMSVLSRALGYRKTALSEWMRGLFRPTLAAVAAAYGAVGYHLVPVPFKIEANVREQAATEEQRILATYHQIGLANVEE